MNTTHTGFEAYQTYTALKLHFTTSYNFVKYNGKVNSATVKSFETNKGKFFFYKLSRKYKQEEFFGFLVANFLNDPKIWVGNLLNETCEETHKNWQKVQQSLSYVFEQDLNRLMDLVDNPDDLLKVVDHQWPMLYTLYKQSTVHLETIIILNDIMNFIPMWTKKVDDDVIFPDFVKICEKYKPFINYDKVKFTKILKGKICQNA